MSSSPPQGSPFQSPQSDVGAVTAAQHPGTTALDGWIRFFWKSPAADVGERTRRRLTVRLVPWLFFLYFLAYLDRINVSVAKLQMTEPIEKGGLAFGEDVLGFGMGVFFVGYWILEVPSTLSVLRWGARYVFARILVLWGLACMLVGSIGTQGIGHVFGALPKLHPQHWLFTSLDRVVDFLFGWIPQLFMKAPGDCCTLHWFSDLALFYNGLSHNAEYQFYFFRFLLGFFEGGFFPSVILYLSLWFPTQHRAKAIATFMAAIPISNMLGLPLCGLMLQIDWLGLQGWRWVFFLQGLAPVVAGIVTLFVLPNRPEDVAWLPPDEKDYLLKELAKESHGKKKHADFRTLYSNLGVVLLLTLVYFGLNVSSYGVGMFVPTLVKGQLSQWFFSPEALAALPKGRLDLYASLASAPMYIVGFLAMLLNGWHSDKTGERIWHVALSLMLLSVAMLGLGLTNGWGVIPFLILTFGVGAFLNTHLPAFWPIPTIFLGAAGAASAIGFINMVGNMGGMVGPYIFGQSLSATGQQSRAMLTASVFPLMAGLIVLVVGMYRQVRPAADVKSS